MKSAPENCTSIIALQHRFGLAGNAGMANSQTASLYPCQGKGKTPCYADQQKNLMRINHLLRASKISVACQMGTCRNGIAIHRVQGHSGPKAKELIPRPLEEKAAFSTPRATGGSS
jgi:hypothetical protein